MEAPRQQLPHYWGPLFDNMAMQASLVSVFAGAASFGLKIMGDPYLSRVAAAGISGLSGIATFTLICIRCGHVAPTPYRANFRDTWSSVVDLDYVQGATHRVSSSMLSIFGWTLSAYGLST